MRINLKLLLKAIKDLKTLKMHVAMLTGDSIRVAESIGQRVGISEIYADALPKDKEVKVREFSTIGPVAFVDDGLNGVPALSRADVGIAIEARTNVAINEAYVVLTNSNLSDVCRAIRLSRAPLSNAREKLFWAFFYNLPGIPLTTGIMTPRLGWTLSPTFGALVMSLSSICAISNASRLNFARINVWGNPTPQICSASSNINLNISIKETKMKKT